MKQFNDDIVSLVCLMSLAVNWRLADLVQYSAIKGTWVEWLTYGIIGALAFAGFVNVVAFVIKVIKVFRYLLNKAEEAATNGK